MIQFIIAATDKGFKLTAEVNNQPVQDSYNKLQSVKDVIREIKHHAGDAKVFIQMEDGSREQIAM